MLPSLAGLRSSVDDGGDGEQEALETTDAFPQPSLKSLTPSVAQRVVARGSVAFSLMITGGRLVDLLVDLDGVPSVPTYGALRSLVGDSWIMTSSALVPYAGTLDVPTAMIRAAVMLIAKRVWKIQQFAPVREAIVLLHFAALAGKLLETRNKPVSDTLLEISAVPIFVYTAIAEVVRNAGNRIRDALFTQLIQEMHTHLTTARDLPGQGDLERHWRRTIPATTRALHRVRKPSNPHDTLVEWSRVVSDGSVGSGVGEHTKLL